MSWSKTACDTCARSFSASACECGRVVYFFVNVRDLVLVEMGSFFGWISCMFDCCVDLMFDMVRLEIGSWSPLGLAGTWMFLGIVIGCWCNTPLEFITLFLRWPPLEVEGRTDVCLYSTGGGSLVIVCLVLVPVFSNFQTLLVQLQFPPIVNHIY